MKLAISIFFLFAWAVSASASSSLKIVGMHRLQIAEPGIRARLVSIPFLRAPLAYGRLDGVTAATGTGDSATLLDLEAAFSGMTEEATYILRITEGSSVGDWFILDAASPDGLRATVREDGLAGSVAALVGQESFAIHKLFSLGELFPETLPGFASAAIDLAAMQVHFYDGNRFTKHWLSDGTLTDHVGWTYAEGGVLKDASRLAVLPGTSFLVVYPNAVEEQSIQINGVIPDAGLTVPVYPGYNYVSIKYTNSLDGGLSQVSDYLRVLGLTDSGFAGGESSEESDLILALNEADGTFVDGYYYDTNASDFKPVNAEAPEISLESVGPGRGFVILNKGEPYLWEPGK